MKRCNRVPRYACYRVGAKHDNTANEFFMIMMSFALFVFVVGHIIAFIPQDERGDTFNHATTTH